jgi:hypothetical protein
MSGVEQSWRVDGLDETDLRKVVEAGFAGLGEIEGSSLAVAEMELPLFRFEGRSWDVGDFTTKDQIRCRRNMPRGLMLVMREVMAMGLPASAKS